MLILSSSLLLILFLYFITYIFGLTSFISYVNRIFLLLLFLINYASDIYNTYKARASVSTSVYTKISIKPYSNNEYLIDFIIYIGKFLSIISLAMFLINLVKRSLVENLTKH